MKQQSINDFFNDDGNNWEPCCYSGKCPECYPIEKRTVELETETAIREIEFTQATKTETN